MAYFVTQICEAICRCLPVQKTTRLICDGGGGAADSRAGPVARSSWPRYRGHRAARAEDLPEARVAGAVPARRAQAAELRPDLHDVRRRRRGGDRVCYVHLQHLPLRHHHQARREGELQAAGPRRGATGGRS